MFWELRNNSIFNKDVSGSVGCKVIWKSEYLENLQGRLIRNLFREVEKPPWWKVGEVGRTTLILKQETRDTDVWLQNNVLVIFNEDAKTLQWVKKSLFNKRIYKYTCKRMKLNSFLTPHTKIKHKVYHKPKCKN